MNKSCKMWKCWITVAVVVVATLYMIHHTVEGCNEAVCASVVSKCMLTQSCKCDLKNCSCCKECYHCLNYLYNECCSCVGCFLHCQPDIDSYDNGGNNLETCTDKFNNMCPKPNGTNSTKNKPSTTEEFTDPIPALFKALMSEPDSLQRWITFTFPVDFDILSSPHTEYEFQTTQPKLVPANIITLNCTVAYMSQCMSLNKCKASCQSTGAVSYRWFHDGCCECIGDTCINYGINESRCLNCPIKSEETLEEEEEDVPYIYDDYDYGNEEKGDKLL